MGEVRWTDGHALLVVAIVVLALIWATLSGDVLRALMAEPPLGSRLLRSVIIMASDLAVLMLPLWIVVGIGPGAQFVLAGVTAPIARPLLWGLALFVPAAIACVALAPLAPDFSVAQLLGNGLIGPFYEELFYRGLAVGALIRLAGWHWAPAALLPAVFFAVAHLYQGEDVASTAGVLAITGIGGLYFAWLMIRWGWNLWPAVVVHAGLNSLWIIFALGDNALGGVLGNAVRGWVVAASIVSTLWLTRARR